MDGIVLCIQLALLATWGVIPQTGKRMISRFNMNWIEEQHFSFHKRSEVDGKDMPNFSKALSTPQVLPYMLVKYKGSYLTYSRSKGAETRLHGTRSLGFGGHVDDTDAEPGKTITQVILDAAKRELKEELGLDLEKFSQRVNFKHCIVDYTNTVGMVHFGIVAVIDLNDQDMEDMKQCAEELTDVQWRTVEQLQADADQYENWSKALITGEDGYNFQ
ncbi:MAG: NUDIX domain-containing protein [Caryophanon sp.]|nr:NUDIX domain-containing protein [Caryophanon sp.]